ncbi:FlgO family outer membrane protein [Neptuniibacter pectenicola]|uniref:FlgO family outer membrane protein n=1 Tax=Neptuniibacter pectenicola TaxID=1806669 RepID=UPI00082C3774|nr:FlgO family outer membrane protein [Neptuniibacter pectenicola]|tara:strand:- start:155 stop:886 length:732 start_codon:yes stop_codon:yes gene_type:complete
MKKILLLLMVCFLSGCFQQLNTQDKQPEKVHIESMNPEVIEQLHQLEQAHIAEKKALLEKERSMLQRQVVQVETLPNGLDPISEAVAQMAVQMNAGLQQNRVKRFPIAVIPFTNLHNGRKVGRFGERLEQGFIYQLQQHGYNLVDYRATGLTTSTKQPLSKQNLSGLRTRYKVYFLVTGTYAQHSDGLVINARVIDTTTRQVLATGQSHIANERLEGAIPGYNPLEALNQGLIIENRGGPVGR